MPTSAQALDFYRQMLRIRRFEETVLDAFPKGLIQGTTHTYIGQEADAVGVLADREAGDVVVSNHRSHGHYLAYGGPMEALAAELMGRSDGVNGGRGGSQHLQWRDFYANGILGGTIPLAAGMALAEKALGSGRIVIAFTGDGALGQGVLYESLNMASLWRLPLLIVLENNRYAQTTPVELNLAGSIHARFEAFGIPTLELDSTDVQEIHAAAGPILQAVRSEQGPRALILHTYRFAPHSKGDDDRDPAEVARFREKDPITLQAGRLDAAALSAVHAEVESEVGEAFRRAESASPADPKAALASLGTEP